jgi:hypothetical protein
VGAVSLLIALNALYGLGTIWSTHGFHRLPHSSVAPALYMEGDGWREIGLNPAGTLGLTGGGALFALDYSIAGQLSYYTRLPVTTGWPQYRFWEELPICGNGASDHTLQVIGLTYLDPVVVTGRLWDSFRRVEGPRHVSVRGAATDKAFQLWEAQGCTVPAEEVLERLDFLALIQAGKDR